MIVAANPTDLDALRLRHEFLETPGLIISVPQAARMLGVSSEHAARMLTALASESFLAPTPDGSYRRARRVECDRVTCPL